MAIYSMREYDDAVNEFVGGVEMEDAFQIMVENEINYNNIMQSVYNAEKAVYESTGREMIYEGVDLRALKDKFVAFFNKVKEKIKTFFDNLWTRLSSVFRTNENLVKKYGSRVSGYRDTVTIEGYEFTNLNWNVKDGFAKATSATIDVGDIEGKEIENGEDEDKDIAKLMGIPVGNNEEISVAIFKYFRNGKDSTRNIKYGGNKAYNDLKSIDKDFKKNAKKAESDSRDNIENTIKELESMANDADGDNDDKKAKSMRALAQGYKTIINVGHMITTGLIRAYSDNTAQTRRAFLKILNETTKKKSTSVNASAIGSYLDDVELV